MPKETTAREIENDINRMFPDAQLEYFDYPIFFHEIQLRFELGDKLKLGTKKRVDQAVKRAVEIFDKLFSPDDAIYLMAERGIYPTRSMDGEKAFYLAFRSYLKKTLRAPLISRKVVVPLEEGEQDDGGFVQRDFVACTAADVNFAGIFRAIANNEMGLEPSFPGWIDIIGRNGMAFRMYDDRGCIVYADRKEKLIGLYRSHNHWLVDCWRPTFDSLFANYKPEKADRMTTYLLKTEPTVYSFDDLLRDGTTTWDGVANATALKHLRAMKKGDTAIIYHTGDEKAAVGLATITANATIDAANVPTVKLKAGKRLPKPVTLTQIKADKTFADLPIVRIPRLSVMPLPEAAAKHLLKLAGA